MKVKKGERYMMKKILIYAMEGKEMCFMHALMNA